MAQENWLLMYEALKTYFKQHGNANVPDRWETNPKLSSWVKTQRRRYKANLIPSEQLDLLNRLGFEWGRRKREHWEDRLQELIIFKHAHGHFDVPFDYPDVPKLGAFVNNTRSQYGSGRLSPTRIAALESIGFNWKAARWSAISPKWKGRFDELADYQRANGHCNVPSDWEQNKPLGIWVGRQRSLYRAGELNPERISMLESLGFKW